MRGKKQTNEIKIGHIATPDELRQFWSVMFTDLDVNDHDRLKASELLGRSMGMFIDTDKAGNEALGTMATEIIKALSREENV